MRKIIGVLAVAALAIAGWLTIPAFADVTVTLTATTVSSSVISVPAGTVSGSGYTGVVSVDCPTGETVLGGGYALVLSDGSDVASVNDLGPDATVSRPKSSGDGWEASFSNGASAIRYAKIYARCV